MWRPIAVRFGAAVILSVVTAGDWPSRSHPIANGPDLKSRRGSSTLLQEANHFIKLCLQIGNSLIQIVDLVVDLISIVHGHLVNEDRICQL